ncbi:hypothetical protein M426DRAFT_13577 [Hypoxylon sp. CI-4A]|nr:hypothetical protein M426DRAFT_13577 [Hypoxylon sp. CI-4A]
MATSWNKMDLVDIAAQIPTIAGLCYLTAAIAFMYIPSVCVYNRYFHPLAGFPGPFLGSLTEWYLVYVICSVPTFGLELHKKYGPIIRLAPNMLSFSDATLLPQVYHRYADKPRFYDSWMFGKTAAMFQSLKHEDHYAKKRLVAPCCSMTTMKANHEEKISECIDELCVKIEERSSKAGKPLDFSEHLRQAYLLDLNTIHALINNYTGGFWRMFGLILCMAKLEAVLLKAATTKAY